MKLRFLSLKCHVHHGAQILGVVMQSSKKRPRLERAESRQQHISASVVQPAIPADPLLELQQIWTIRPSHHQPPSTDFELTHKRPVPLPFAIDLVINGKTHACLYSGHGQSKVVYRVLKSKCRRTSIAKAHGDNGSRTLCLPAVVIGLQCCTACSKNLPYHLQHWAVPGAR